MQWGIFHYDFVYMPRIRKVCINTTGTSPATVICYTVKELRQLAEVYKGVNPLYREALEYFPKELL